MNKVKLPKEVAEAIKTIRDASMCEHGLYDRKWLVSDIDDTPTIRKAKDTILNYIDRTDDRFDESNQLINYYKGLVNGYEVEQTPEEKVRKLYQHFSKIADNSPGYYNGVCRGINECLDALNIKIEGVNA